MEESREVEVHGGDSPIESIPVSQLVTQMALIQDAMSKVMKDGIHFGKVPGCGEKPSLLKPGAEKLEVLFRLAPHCNDMGGQVLTTDLPNGHKTFEVHTAMVHIPTGKVWAVGVGACSTMESKYRFRNAARKCPECGKETIIKGKAEYGGGWLCFGKKGGCGEKFSIDDKQITDQVVGKIEHDNPADYYNTCLKIAKKRSQVDGVISATACSDIFTQDLEDLKANGVITDAEVVETKSAATVTPEAGKSETATEKPAGARTALLAAALKVIGDSSPSVTRWAIGTKKIQKGQTWQNLPDNDLKMITESGKGFMVMINNYIDGGK
jgi:hypothetical protein